MLNLSSFIVFFSFISSCVPQKDPLKDFCCIHGHQTTIVDRRLYIDGGLINWSPLSAESINYTSAWLRYGDLDVDNEGLPQQYLLTKNEPVSSVQGGILWPDTSNKVVYLYGGEYGNDKPEDFILWYYDIIYDTWNRSDVRNDRYTASFLGYVSFLHVYCRVLMTEGAGVTVQDKARSYYYGGWLTNSSVPGYQPRTALRNMLVYDMLANSFKNQSGPDIIPRAEGVMIYLPAGDSGLLVYFGGIQFPYSNGTAEALPMNDILVYDIGNDLWYKQKASGFWPREEDGVGATFPHHSLTCDVIENSQMIIMGGSFPNMSAECDVPDVYGQHGLDLGKANADGAKWALFNPNVTRYKFQRAYTPTSRTPTRYIPTSVETSTSTLSPITPGGSRKNVVIAGAVGGGVGGLLLVIATVGICFCFRRRKRIKEGERHSHSGPPSQSMAQITSPTPAQQCSFPSPGLAQHTNTPQNSPSPPSYRPWSDYAPSCPTLSAVAAPQEVFTVPSPPLQEMPNVRSPISFGTQQQSGEPCTIGIDPYFAQHPPKAAETDGSSRLAEA
ncbi:hypothetical protein J3E74DRAFT_411020 [Bipolaris maydis]|nr:hypothetical protein J3E74DRAFT_413653 [Bipolaris maydis]KAJ5056329.1 hypothetical protein J3E74DRAFT_411020 [Bipolaris maydis]